MRFIVTADEIPFFRLRNDMPSPAMTLKASSAHGWSYDRYGYLSLDGRRVIALDTETGGLSPYKNPILSISVGTICMNGSESPTVATNTAYMLPSDKEIQPRSIDINGLTMDRLHALRARSMPEAMRSCIMAAEAMADGQPIAWIAQNASFDMGFIQQAIPHIDPSCARLLTDHPWFCTRQSIMRATGRGSLDDLCRVSGQPNRPLVHQADDDVRRLLIGCLYLKNNKIVPDRIDMSTLRSDMSPTESPDRRYRVLLKGREWIQADAALLSGMDIGELASHWLEIRIAKYATDRILESLHPGKTTSVSHRRERCMTPDQVRKFFSAHDQHGAVALLDSLTTTKTHTQLTIDKHVLHRKYKEQESYVACDWMAPRERQDAIHGMRQRKRILHHLDEKATLCMKERMAVYGMTTIEADGISIRLREHHPVVWKDPDHAMSIMLPLVRMSS
jgi:DNA polymerase III epsilon subunit-like protein